MSCTSANRSGITRCCQLSITNLTLPTYTNKLLQDNSTWQLAQGTTYHGQPEGEPGGGGEQASGNSTDALGLETGKRRQPGACHFHTPGSTALPGLEWK